MCMCAKNNINGTPGYNWNSDEGPNNVYPVRAPEVPDGFRLVFDEPGRCQKGKLDSHSYHLRLVRDDYQFKIMCRHGGGTESYEVGRHADMDVALAPLDSYSRYWMLLSIWHACRDAKVNAESETASAWRQAVANKWTKVRRRNGRVYVTIEKPAMIATA